MPGPRCSVLRLAKSFGTCQRTHKDLDEEREDSKEEEGRKLSIKRRLRGTFVKSPPLSQSVMVLSPGMDLSDSSSSGERPLDMCEEATEQLEQRDAAGSSSKLWETPRWILSLRQDLSERSSLELEERRTPSADDAFSIAYVRETLFKFERVDDCLKDGHHEYLKLVRWKHPVRSMLFFLVTLHSLWSDYLLPLLLLSAIGCLVQSFFMHSSAYAGNTTENDEGKLTIVDSVSKMLKLDMRVSKSFQEASDVFDKIVSLATWRNPKITLCLLAFLLATFFVAEVVGSAGAFRILGTLLLVKAFLVDHAFSRFPRLAAKYDLLSDAWAALPVRPGTSAKCRGKERLAQISR
ncbi:GRAM domain-containing protein 4 [Ixodes scapularis]